LLTDLRSGRIISDGIGLNVSSFSRRMSTTGELSATLPLSDRRLRELTDPVTATEPRRTALWIIRNEQVVWGGIIWTRRYRSADMEFEIGATTFESYFERRRIRSTLRYPNWDQHRILAGDNGLVHQAQMINTGTGAAALAGDIKVLRPAWSASNIMRDRTYWWHERATYLERMQQLAEVENGPDFTIEPRWDNIGNPQAALVVGTPIQHQTQRILEFPGDFRNYSWPEDGGGSANFWTAIGEPDPADQSQEPPPMMRDASMSAEWQKGIPLLEDISQHQGVTVAATLQAYANANVKAAANNRIVPEATLRLGEDDVPNLGDVVTARFADPVRFPAVEERPGLVARMRVTGWTIYLSEDEGESVSMELTEPVIV
jgi:hypothetical protein